MPSRDRLWRFKRRSASAIAIRGIDQGFASEGGWELAARLFVPRVDRPAPAVLLVPGMHQGAGVFEGYDMPVRADEIARLGAVVMALDLAGRGRSWGTDTYGGPEHHGDVRSALRLLARHSKVDPDRVSVISFSLGCAAVAGALASRDRPKVAFWIDWEGPSDREIITAGGRFTAPAAGHAIDDDAYWYAREAVRYVGRTGVPYLRYQSIRDHAQPGELRHATRMIRAAADGDLPWFQLNDHARGDVPAVPMWMPAGLHPAHHWIVGRVRELHHLP